MKLKILSLIFSLFFLSCTSDDAIDSVENLDEIYFPSISNLTWETVSLTALNWNENNLQPLLDFVEQKDSKAFIILKNGRIAVEWYANNFDEDKLWYWASAGKTLTATTIGIAEQEGLLTLTEASNKYLGNGWTDATIEQENDITIWNQLTMTTGLDDIEFDCTEPNCLPYLTNPNTRWSYHNAPYTLLESVIGGATNTTFKNYYNLKLRDKIGMNGFWTSTNGFNNVYFSNARSMARFGHLILNNGTWDDNLIINKSFVNDMINPSQIINKSYGYLWWLNGKESFMLPGTQIEFSGSIIPNAPNDLVAGLGKNDQKLYVIPSQNLVIIRLGEIADENSPVPITFDNDLWEYINALID